MLIDLKPVINTEGAKIPVFFDLNLSDVDVQGVKPFPEPVRLRGQVLNRAGVIELQYSAEFSYHGICDRCLSPFVHPMNLPFFHILVFSLTGEDQEDEFIVMEVTTLDLAAQATSDILLALPMKQLCRQDCAGLCPTCGADLNQGKCGCGGTKVDPRLEILKTLIN